MKKSAENDKIMREAAPLFYDGEFIKQMDANRYLMCFTNISSVGAGGKLNSAKTLS